MKKLLSILGLTTLISACNSTSSEDFATSSDLQHHRWELTSINGENVSKDARGQVPDLEIGESMFANGFAGCNTFRGQAQLNPETGQFRIDKMAMTMKMCQGVAMDIERSVSQTLSAWSDLDYEKNSLTISNGDNTLVYTLKDRM